MKIVRKTKFDLSEVVPSTTTTIQGSALSVYELYQKMIVGSIDAAGYVRPFEYDDQPDIDSPDPLNTFGLDVGEVEEMQANAVQTFKRERKGKTAKEPVSEPLREPVEPKPGDKGGDQRPD